MFEFSSERIDTGIPEIDNTINKFSLANTGPTSILSELGGELTTEDDEIIEMEYHTEYRQERNFQNIIIQTESDLILDHYLMILSLNAEIMMNL